MMMKMKSNTEYTCKDMKFVSANSEALHVLIDAFGSLLFNIIQFFSALSN